MRVGQSEEMPSSSSSSSRASLYLSKFENKCFIFSSAQGGGSSIFQGSRVRWQFLCFLVIFFFVLSGHAAKSNAPHSQLKLGNVSPTKILETTREIRKIGKIRRKKKRNRGIRECIFLDLVAMAMLSLLHSACYRCLVTIGCCRFRIA